MSLRDWLEAPGEELRERYDRLYVPRNDPRYLRRNALVALGNSGDESLAPLAERYAEGGDEMLADHARWALDRLREGRLVRQISEFEWELERKEPMRVPGRVFASERMIEAGELENALEQVRNVACLPGIVKASYAMPDIHWGYGFPIGGVAAFDVEEGVISPGGVGYDIACGVRLIRSDLRAEELRPRLPELLHELSRACPTGTGHGGEVEPDRGELELHPPARRPLGGRARLRDGATISSCRRTTALSRAASPATSPTARTSEGGTRSARSAPATTSSRCRRSSRSPDPETAARSGSSPAASA